MSTVRRILVSSLIVWFSLGSPIAVLAQEAVDAAGNPTGPTQETGAPECTGAGCHQGENQGIDQGLNQGLNQGVTNGITAANTNSGADSTNNATASTTATTNTALTNTATDATTGAATGTTGGNTANQNSGTGGITSGNAGIGVTQVKNDNTSVIGGTAGLTTTGYNGDHQGDLNIGFGDSTANLAGPNGGSVRATNDTTGSNSTNGVDVTTTTEQLTEVQNDGHIDNVLDLVALTGQNEASQNTGGGQITTGDADVAATLVNLLNTTVVNGDLWVTVADIFGDLNGNIVIPDLGALASAFRGSATTIDAGNTDTGNNSANTIDVALKDTDTTNIRNDADINTTINADAITGGNTAQSNTGGSAITTGDATVTGSNISVANTTVEGGNWGLFIVNALNGWLGFLVGDDGSVQALSQDETLRRIEAQNATTGADSTNTIAVTDENNRTTNVTNDAVINNDINAQAITGQNTASENTGQGVINTGNASVEATAVNIANTTVKDGSLFIAVVNILGDWFGDLFYNGNSLAQTAAAQQAANQVDINAGNTNTGASSTNDVNVDIDHTHDTTINNDADLNFALNANVDTGNNHANRNTQAASITTGEGFLAQHARTIANVTAIAEAGGLAVNITGDNHGTGFDSRNTIHATVNDNRVITVNNDANVTTLLGSPRDPAIVNTGNNEANQNTLGALITTGNANADIAVQNLVNRVMVALLGAGVTVDANFANSLTGALSENTNQLDVIRNALVNVTNEAVINTILNLLLNTGGNTANDNTAQAAITTGSVCVNGHIENKVNTKDIHGVTGKTLTNNGVINNEANIQGTTGGNELNRNTGGGTAGENEGCEKEVAAAPTPTPGPGGMGGGEEEQVTEEQQAEAPGMGGAVAGAISKHMPAIKGQIMTRFPVAGGFVGRWWQLLLAAAAFIGLAWHFDRRAQRVALPLR